MEFFDLLGVSLLVAALSGITMGLYLSAVNGFAPVAQPGKALTTNIVVAFSFFLPIAMQRVLTGDPTLDAVAWSALIFLYLVFATCADLTNYLICRYRGSN